MGHGLIVFYLLNRVHQLDDESYNLGHAFMDITLVTRLSFSSFHGFIIFNMYRKRNNHYSAAPGYFHFIMVEIVWRSPLI